ncbi:hypothetical protein L7F22_007502 [Adiantum nelumboides]|nr:hypothetical protein [Adiantum nelumboides]
MTAGAVMVVVVGWWCCIACTPAAARDVWEVGDASGWTSTVDYKIWARDKTFRVGDDLFFWFNVSEHDVVEVTKDGYDSCDEFNNTLETWNFNDNATVELKEEGDKYYMSSSYADCPPMRLAITVIAATSPPTSTSPATSSGDSEPAPSSGDSEPTPSASTSNGTQSSKEGSTSSCPSSLLPHLFALLLATCIVPLALVIL